MLHMVIEQTYKYPMRMKYNHETGEFIEREYKSLQYERNFTKPYGWIKESGTPPFPHWDCILMTNTEYELGDEVEIKIIGLFKRKDFDHKYVVVKVKAVLNGISSITNTYKIRLQKDVKHWIEI